MRKERIENGRILVDNGYGTTYDFEIVEKVPADYSVWCFPEILGGEYTPFCKTVKPDNKDCFDVDIETLKAVKLSKEENEILHHSAHAGAGNIAKANRLLKRSAKTAYMKQKQERARKALPILERITA